MYAVNINGFMSKLDSLASILDNIQPDVVTLNETKVKNSGKLKTFFKERGYDVLIRVNGGIAIAARNKFKIINVTTTENKHILTGLISNLNIRIIAGYGPQETVPKEDREFFFDDLSTEVQASTNLGNKPVIIGDLNAKIEPVDGTLSSKSSNGDLLLDVINEHELEVLNYNLSCTGKWTRVQNVCGEEIKSVLDYCITNTQLANSMESMLIDEEKVFCPFRIIKPKKGEIHQQYSDHNALLVKFNITVINRQEWKGKAR